MPVRVQEVGIGNSTLGDQTHGDGGRDVRGERSVALRPAGGNVLVHQLLGNPLRWGVLPEHVTRRDGGREGNRSVNRKVHTMQTHVSCDFKE